MEMVRSVVLDKMMFIQPQKSPYYSNSTPQKNTQSRTTILILCYQLSLSPHSCKEKQFLEFKIADFINKNFVMEAHASDYWIGKTTLVTLLQFISQGNATVYHIWKHRNAVLHKGCISSEEQIVATIRRSERYHWVQRFISLLWWTKRYVVGMAYL